VRGARILGGGVLATLLLAVSGPLPAGAAGGGQGQSPDCSAQLISTRVTYNRPVAVLDGQAAACYYSSGMPGQSFGTPPGKAPVVHHPPGTDCWRVIYEPNTFRVNDDGSVSQYTPPSVADGGGWYTWPTGYGNFLGLGHLNMAETSNVYTPFLGHGTWDASGTVCNVPNGPSNGNGLGWEAGCTPPGPPGLGLDQLIMYTGLSSEECVHTEPNPVVGNPRATVGQLVPILRGLNADIAPGTLTSMPQQAGLVNVPTCFWIEPPASPAQNAFDGEIFDIVIPGQPDGNGRIVFYTFRVTLAAPQLTWHFGDNSGSDDGMAPQCAGQHPEAVAHAGHVYRAYDARPGYQVTVEEDYPITIDEYWWDTGQHHVTIDPAAVGAAPPHLVAGPYLQPVLQEEGVPVQ
jgi:hypothetical protein